MGFFMNLPIGLLLLVAAPRFIPTVERRSGHLDLAGVLTSTAGMTALVYGITRSTEAGWGDPTTVALLVAGLVLLALFVLNERRAAQPLMPLRLFASRERVGAYLGRFLFLGSMISFWFFATQYLQEVRGYSSLAAGLAFLPATLPNFAMALLVPRLSRRFGNARVLVLGLASAVIGMAWLSRLGADTDYLTGLALPMVLIGIGQGGCLAPLTVAGIAGVGEDDAGAASGVVNAVQQLGSSLGLSLLVTIFAAIVGPSAPTPDLLTQGIGTAMAAGAVMLALALVAVVALIAWPRPTRAVKPVLATLDCTPVTVPASRQAA
jgi:Na+/melibiose symporter-like transporter